MKQGVLVVSHGSQDTDWVRLVDEAVAAMKLPAGVPVEAAFLELVEGRLIQDGIDRLEQQQVTEIIAVPLFVSSGSTHVDEIGYALGAYAEPGKPTELERFRMQAALRWCDPIDDDPDIAEIVYQKLKPLSEQPEREIVVIVGHGSNHPGFHQRWSSGLDRLAERIKDRGKFAAAEGAMLLPDQTARTLVKWERMLPGHTVIVAALFLSEGYFTRRVIPARFASHDHRYTGAALLPHPLITSWMERQVGRWLIAVIEE